MPWSRPTGCLGLDEAADRDDVFRQLVVARIIEPSSKLGSLQVLEEPDAPLPSAAGAGRAA